MNNIAKTNLLLIASLLTIGCKQIPEYRSDAPQAPPIVGGWSQVSPIDQQSQKAANYALAQRPDLTLERIVSAKRQVVAGMNHDIVLQTTDGQLWQAIIYETLDSGYELTQPLTQI